MIVRFDQLARNDDLHEKLQLTHWDLLVVGKLTSFPRPVLGKKVSESKHFKLGKLLGSITRHFLLKTVMLHNGKEEDFQLFLSLLDSDRFYGKFRKDEQKVDVTDLMRRIAYRNCSSLY